MVLVFFILHLSTKQFKYFPFTL